MRSAVTLFVGLLASTALSAPQPEDAPDPVLDPVALEAFLDGYMSAYLEASHVAGATVSVVEGDALVLAKGYGLADVSDPRPVDAARTLFRIGSVSKLFVWTSVMQLVESGRIDLETDVNTYLTDWKVPESDEGPVTLSQLMTHTAGFDERVLGLFSDDESALRPIGDILRDELPARVRPGGDLTSYSNHGTALAMYVVEQVTGTPWDAYVRREILAPLGMERTSFDQPLPATLSSDLATGYRFQGGAWHEAPFELIPLAPVGAASTTATDMARFLSAHLGGGRVGEARVLGEAASRRMQTTLFRHHPGVNGMAHGFMELDWNGERIVGHGGDTELFHTLFAFLPERNIGIFASFNTVGADYLRLLRAFVEWRFPVERMREAEAAEAPAIGRFAGVYRQTRYEHETLAKLAALVGSLEVRAEAGRLVLVGQKLRYFVPEAGLLFREEGGRSTLAFREAADGTISHLFLGELPVIAFERAPAAESPGLVVAVLGGAISLLLAAIVFWPAAALARWHYGAHLTKDERIPGVARWSAWLAGCGLASFLAAIGAMFSNPMSVVYGISGPSELWFWVPLVAAVLWLVSLAGAFHAWRAGRGSFVGRVAFSVVNAAAGLVLWQLHLWNLLGFRY